MTGVDFQILLPEILLAVYALVALMFGVYGGKDKLAGLLTWATAGLFVALALLIALRDGVGATAFGGMFVDDAFARFAKVVVLVSAAGVLVMAQDYMARRDLARFEYPILATLSVIGMMVMVSAGDLMALYMGLELQSLALYVMAAMRRDSVKSTEAGLKWGAVVGPAAVRGFAGVRLCWDDRLCRDRFDPDGRPRAFGPAVRSGVPDLGHGLQGFGSPLPHVDPGRL